jgi:hypothetical protein
MMYAERFSDWDRCKGKNFGWVKPENILATSIPSLNSALLSAHHKKNFTSAQRNEFALHLAEEERKIDSTTTPVTPLH